MAEAVVGMGRVDFVAANAGIGAGAPFAEMHHRDLAAGAVRQPRRGRSSPCARPASTCVERAKAGDPGGSLVVTSSVSAVHGAPRNEAYAADQGRGDRHDAGPGGRVRPLRRARQRHPARLDPLGHDRGAPRARTRFNEKVIGRVPVGRWGEPEDFAGIAVYLASDASQVPHRRHLRDRRRLHGFLARTTR